MDPVLAVSSGRRYPKTLLEASRAEPYFAALLAYDYLLTLDQEVRLIWKQKKTGATLLFLIIRYWALLSLVFLSATSYGPMSDHAYVPSRLDVESIEVMFVASAARRASSPSKRFSWERTDNPGLLPPSVLRPASARSDASELGSILDRVHPLLCAVCHQHVVCDPLDEPTRIPITPASSPKQFVDIVGTSLSRSCAIAADILLIAMSWWYAAQGWTLRDFRKYGMLSGLTRVMLLNGEQSAKAGSPCAPERDTPYLDVARSEILRAATVHRRHADSILKIRGVTDPVSEAVVFTDPLTAILICRLLLALQAANLKASSHGVEETWINESDTIRFATIELGSMGGPVASGPNSELFDVEEGSTAIGVNESERMPEDTLPRGQSVCSVAYSAYFRRVAANLVYGECKRFLASCLVQFECLRIMNTGPFRYAVPSASIPTSIFYSPVQYPSRRLHVHATCLGFQSPRFAVHLLPGPKSQLVSGLLATMSQTASADLVPLIASAISENRIGLASLALLAYEYLITFTDEVRLIWLRKKTGATFLFLIIRYHAMITLLILQSITFVPVSSEVYAHSYMKGRAALTVHPISCSLYAKVQVPLQFSEFVPWAAFSSLRVLALSRMNYPLALLVFVLACGPFAVNVWQVAVAGISGFNIPVAGCFGASGETPAQAKIGKRVIIARTCAMAADSLVIAVSWWYGATTSSFRGLRHQTMPLAQIVLVNGTIYFIALLILNALHLTFTLVSIVGVANAVSEVIVLTDPLTAILICRFLLALHAADCKDAGSPLDDSVLGETSDRGGTLRFASAIASMGADLATRSGESSLAYGDELELTAEGLRGDEVECA
ncbi:hypothetical protein NUW54_g4497 [Trametes sanguinea]|uniref:Uncharacterized protein n=1 Tax=Trametes sanguinea TaxID=158606 RepID=A0ACC1Q0A0_9APHY|nr:hypothetical protein NUW54_g4497 [Trametes sanguinea]